MNISEIVAHKHLLARITALEIAVAQLEKAHNELVVDALETFQAAPVPEKRKPGRPRKQQ